MTLYNEIDPYAAQWIRNLSAAGHIPGGTVDTRSITELTYEDVIHHAQFHTFAGIAVWAHALKEAGWGNRPVWTGSCPCQPFSSAGRRKGTADERHLWPAWFDLIRQCKPAAIFGEQVASPDGLAWFDAVRADLEGAGYAVGASDLCAAGTGAPHIRQRLYFVAIAHSKRRHGEHSLLRTQEGRQREGAIPEVAGSGAPGSLGDSQERRRQARDRNTEDAANAKGGRAGPAHARQLGNSVHARPQERSRDTDGRGAVRIEGSPASASGDLGTSGFWSPADWLPCQDGRSRPVEPGTQPLAHGVTNRVGKLRAYGNAICAPVAITFVQAVMELLKYDPA